MKVIKMEKRRENNWLKRLMLVPFYLKVPNCENKAVRHNDAI